MPGIRIVKNCPADDETSAGWPRSRRIASAFHRITELAQRTPVETMMPVKL